MKLAILLVLSVCPVFASLIMSSAVVGSDGRTFTVTMNGTGISGSTASCFSVSGSADPQFNGAVTSAVIATGSTLTLVTNAPAYHPDTLVVSLSANPTCALTGSTGNTITDGVTATNNSDYYAAGDAHWSGLITYQGSVVIGSDGNGYPNTAQFTSANASIDLNVTSSSGTISVWTFDFSNAITLIADSVISSRVALSASTTYSETAFTGLETGAHVFRLEQSSAASSYPDFEAIRCPGCVFSTPPATRPIFGICGASAADIQGGGSATGNADQTHYGLLSAAFGITAQGFSSSGQALYPTLEAACPSQMQPKGGAHPFMSFMQPDSNDMENAVSLPNYQAACQKTTTDIMAEPAAPLKLFWISPYVTDIASKAVYDGYAAACVAGVAAAANSSTTYVHTVDLPNGGPDWMNSECSPEVGADLIQSDCLHPNAATAMGQPGYGRYANREAPIVAGQLLGSSFTITGPSTVEQNYVSTSFTATIGGSSAGVTWMDTLTITSSVSSDQICIVGGSCGTGSLAVPGSLSSSTFQFTVAPITTGNRTIGYTNLPDGWIAPASNTLTASPYVNPIIPTYLIIG